MGGREGAAKKKDTRLPVVAASCASTRRDRMSTSLIVPEPALRRHASLAGDTRIATGNSLTLGIRSDTHDDPMELISPIIRRPSIGKEKTSLLDRRPTTCPRDRRLVPPLTPPALVLGIVGEEPPPSTA